MSSAIAVEEPTQAQEVRDNCDIPDEWLELIAPANVAPDASQHSLISLRWMPKARFEIGCGILQTQALLVRLPPSEACLKAMLQKKISYLRTTAGIEHSVNEQWL